MSKPMVNTRLAYLLCAVGAALVAGSPASLFSAEVPDSSPIVGPKHVTVHNVKGVVGPSLQIDDQGRIYTQNAGHLFVLGTGGKNPEFVGASGLQKRHFPVDSDQADK